MAAETKWTPGPWLIGMNNVHAGGIATIYHCTDGYAEIWSEKWIEVGSRPEIHDANARLIAAAPDLYAIVETFDAYMAQAGEEAEQDSLDPIRALRWNAQRALAKARGEQ